MRKHCLRHLPSLALAICLSGCFYEESVPPEPVIVDGYRPVYGTQAMKKIELVESRELNNPGKIYKYKNFLLVCEINEGIHVFDNADAQRPKPVGFIRIIGNSDMAIKDDVLYADHMGNVVAVTIDNFKTLTTEGTLPLQNWNLGLPPPAGLHFECVDESKGIVIDWKKARLLNPACYALN